VYNVLATVIAVRKRRRTGAAMVLMLLLLIVVLAMVAFSVDLGLMVLLRAQIQNAVDSGALAATLKLQDDPGELDKAEATAREYVRLNHVGMTALVPEYAIEVEQGWFDCETDTFTPGGAPPNAVRVFARQVDQPFFFARVFGHTTFAAPAPAIASSAPNLDVMMVLDLSGSMGDEGRIEALRNAAPTFVDVIERFGGDDQIGVMGLAADPEQYDPVARGHTGTLYASGLHPTADHYVGVLEAVLTGDLETLRNNALNSDVLQDGKYTGWTGTGAALADAAHYLTYGPQARETAKKVIVLMSDGHANKPTGNGPGYALEMADYAAGHDVTVYTVSLGDDADVALMQAIADRTAGQHFDATGSGVDELTKRLTKAFKHAAEAIKRVQLVR